MRPADVALYVRDGGGYECIMRALVHYRQRLKTITKSPELENAAMFAQVIQQEASRTGPKVDSLIAMMPDFLHRPAEHAQILSEYLPIMAKAVDSYSSGIRKAMDAKSEYYVRLLGDAATRKELTAAENAANELARLSK